MSLAALVNADALSTPDLEIPLPFEAPPDASLEQLFEGRHYGAVVARTKELLVQQEEPATLNDVAPVLRIWFYRLKSLLALRLGSQVAEECEPWMELLESREVRALPDVFLWDLRVLLVPVKAKGINHAAILQLHLLASEARKKYWLARKQQVAAAETDKADDGKSDQGDTVDAGLGAVNYVAEWDGKVFLAGLYVAAALITLGDFPSALEVLETMYSQAPEDRKKRAAGIIAIVYTQIGDTDSARKWLGHGVDPSLACVIENLCRLADGEWDKVERGDTVQTANAYALALLQSGDIAASIAELERLAVEKDTPLSIIQNLYVLYDLCHENARPVKNALANRMIKAGRTNLESYDFFK